MSNNSPAFKAMLAQTAERAEREDSVSAEDAEKQVLAVLKEIDAVEKEWLSLPEETRERIRSENPGLAKMFVSVKQ